MWLDQPPMCGASTHLIVLLAYMAKRSIFSVPNPRDFGDTNFSLIVVLSIVCINARPSTPHDKHHP